MAPTPAPQNGGAKLRPLVGLLPYLARYRWHAVAALFALVVAAVTTLVVPIAIRRMIDFGFSRDSATLIGRGKVEEVKRRCEEEGADVVFFDEDLSPAQQREIALTFDKKFIHVFAIHWSFLLVTLDG